MPLQDLLVVPSAVLCAADADFCTSGAEFLFEFFSQAQSPSMEDHEGVASDVEVFASSFFTSCGASACCGEGGGIAFDAMGVTPWPVKEA